MMMQFSLNRQPTGIFYDSQMRSEGEMMMIGTVTGRDNKNEILDEFITEESERHRSFMGVDEQNDDLQRIRNH